MRDQSHHVAAQGRKTSKSGILMVLCMKPAYTIVLCTTTTYLHVNTGNVGKIFFLEIINGMCLIASVLESACVEEAYPQTVLL